MAERAAGAARKARLVRPALDDTQWRVSAGQSLRASQRAAEDARGLRPSSDRRERAHQCGALFHALRQRRRSPAGLHGGLVSVRGLEHRSNGAAAPSPPSLESVLRAAIAPTLGLMREHAPFMQIVGRMFSDPNTQFQRRAEAKPLFRRFMRDLASAVPHVPPEELAWRVHFLRGAMIYTWTSAEQLRVVPRGRARPEDDATMVRRLIQFGAAGLRAALSE